MALPKIDTPTYELKLPVSKKKIKFRPFLVKEQKNLLMAMESNEGEDVQRAVKDILNNCTLTDNVNIDVLPIVDIEYYFINLRARSVGEVVDSKYKCTNIVDNKECGGLMEHKLNLLDMKIEMNEEVGPEIKLDDKLTIKFKYPEFGFIKNFSKYDNANDLTFALIAQSIEWVYDGEQYYYAKEQTTKELQDFIESMRQDQFNQVEKFFTNLPRLKQTIRMKCGKCGFDHNIDVEGLESFFG
jgi:hypothetical protein